MKEIKLNLIDGLSLPLKIEEKPKKKGLEKFLFRFSVFILITAIFFVSQTIFSNESILVSWGRLPVLRKIASFVMPGSLFLKGEEKDRINILILGMGGVYHEGPYLTDTIILASLRPSLNEAALISIPRDLYLPTKEWGWKKINAINALAVEKGKGGEKVAEAIEEILDLDIHYFLTVDFDVFEDLINFLGGIEVEVERSFVDYQFPGPNFSYQVVAFSQGKQILTGRRALQFSRSRHGTNNEDTDFARSRRQMKIIEGVRKKIFEQNFLSDPEKIYEVYKIFKNKVKTNLNLFEIIRLAKIAKNFSQEKIINYVFEAGTNGLFIPETNLSGQYILRVRNDDFSQMAEIVKNIFNLDQF